MTTFNVISSDDHFIEPKDLWLKYINPKFKERAPQVKHDSATNTDVFWVEGLKPLPMGMIGAAGKKTSTIKPAGRYDEDIPLGGYDYKARLEAMAKDGIDAQVIYPTICLRLFGVEDSELGYACLEAYNNWVADWVKQDPARFRVLGVISLDDVKRGVKELYRCKDMGIGGAMICLSPDGATAYSDAVYDPFWAAAEETGLPISFHSGTGRKAANTTSYGDTAVKFNLIQRTLADLIFSGVFFRYPKLKVVSAENDAGWIAHFMHRLDRRYAHSRGIFDTPIMKSDMMPSDYMRRNVYATFMDDPLCLFTRDFIGVDNLMWSSDYPHHESTWPNSQRMISDHFKTIPADDKRKILAENVARLYGFN